MKLIARVVDERTLDIGEVLVNGQGMVKLNPGAWVNLTIEPIGAGECLRIVSGDDLVTTRDVGGVEALTEGLVHEKA